jgi:uncharacterized protein YegL
MRKLPVYVMVDTSGSMYGEPIEAVKNGFAVLISALKRDPQALEMAYLSVITFAATAQQVLPLTEIAQLTTPNFSAGGGTSMGAALDLVVKCAEREVAKYTPDSKGDYKPLVFLLTDGIPTDNIDVYLPAFLEYKWGIVVACAAGAQAAPEALVKIAGKNVLLLSDCDSQSLSAFFKFLSSSISTSSKRIDTGTQVTTIDDLPPLPPEISLLKY